MKGKIEKLIKKYKHQMERYEKKEAKLKENEENLSIHGYWSMGCFGSKALLYADIIDDLKEIIGVK